MACKHFSSEPFNVNYFSRFQKFNDALQVLKYLYLTKGLKLTYNQSHKSDIMSFYVYADWVGDIIDRTSPLPGL